MHYLARSNLRQATGDPACAVQPLNGGLGRSDQSTKPIRGWQLGRQELRNWRKN